MLKRNRILLLITTTLLLIGCSSPKDEVITPQPAPQEPKENLQEKQQQSPQENQHAITEVTSATFKDRNITLIYPQINIADEAQKNQINKLIKTEAMKGLGSYPEHDSNLTFDLNYEIKWQGPRLLSIQYSGVGYYKGAAHPNRHFYTTNIDLEKGKLVRLSDLIKIDQDFLATFKSGKWKAVEEHQARVLSDYTEEELQAKLLGADSLGNSEDFMYLTSNTFGLSIGGIPHAIGDHAEFEINIAELRNHINLNSAIWNDWAELLR